MSSCYRHLECEIKLSCVALGHVDVSLYFHSSIIVAKYNLIKPDRSFVNSREAVAVRKIMFQKFKTSFVLCKLELKKQTQCSGSRMFWICQAKFSRLYKVCTW